ncbi:GAT-like domain-containing protein [Sarocladium strictum]
MIRKFLSKDYNSRPSWQYNAVMLMRILTDNPGETFTRNIDQKFVDTAQALLKNGRDASVRQILMETMDDFENTKLDDQNLMLIVSMWKKEKEEAYKKFGRKPHRSRRDHSSQAQALGMHTQNHYSQHNMQQNAYGLPPPAELAGRLEEARTSAKLLEQVVMNTPPNEILGNELIREFADRCVSASRSIQAYMSSQNPVPDNDTMESLIDTNEQLQTALNQHQRAMLNARKLERTDSNIQQSPEMNGANQLLPRQDSALSFGSNGGSGLLPLSTAAPGGSGGIDIGLGASGSGTNTPSNGKGKATETSYEPPPGPPPGHAAALASGSGSSAAQQPRQDEVWDDPFADPQDNPVSAGKAAYQDPRHAQEPFHPGFGGSGQQAQRKPAGLDDDDIYDSPQQTKAPEVRY